MRTTEWGIVGSTTPHRSGYETKVISPVEDSSGGGSVLPGAATGGRFPRGTSSSGIGEVIPLASDTPLVMEPCPGSSAYRRWLSHVSRPVMIGRSDDGASVSRLRRGDCLVAPRRDRSNRVEKPPGVFTRIHDAAEQELKRWRCSKCWPDVAAETLRRSSRCAARQETARSEAVTGSFPTASSAVQPTASPVVGVWYRHTRASTRRACARLRTKVALSCIGTAKRVRRDLHLFWRGYSRLEGWPGRVRPARNSPVGKAPVDRPRGAHRDVDLARRGPAPVRVVLWEEPDRRPQPAIERHRAVGGRA